MANATELARTLSQQLDHVSSFFRSVSALCLTSPTRGQRAHSAGCLKTQSMGSLEALRLAEAIGGAQEEKAQIKAEKRQRKETKALIAARQAQIKKHKAKQRKQAKDGALSEVTPLTTPPTKKKVSFA
ncbi:hypothetical protein EYR40_001599 [Pleurotus pulmonarius]|nr:hypothetical protein EYR40_001599 [Pleurotus pulmonarius]